jgi:phosphatidate phosphatase APP1
MALEPAGQSHQGSRLHRAARIEDAVDAALGRRLLRRGWQRVVVPYTGYGGPGWARVMARVVLAPRDRKTRRRPEKLRGWRSFATLPVPFAPVVVTAGGSRRQEVVADRGGYIDCRVDADLAPGWATVRLESGGAEPVEAPIRVVDPAVQVGLISDIDDTVMVTALPRPFLAAWNTFVLDEHARMAVPGMAVLYERLKNAYPGAPVLYLSTGAWNVASTLNRFLSRHLYPPGPLLLTDWGPTAEGWFRSGRQHKKATLARLATEFPGVRWLLVGDDGQHDPEIYAEFAATHPGNVAAVAIRQLSPTQSVLAGSLPGHADEAARAAAALGNRWMSAPDGAGLWKLLREAGVL